jgi:hypothetical protein
VTFSTLDAVLLAMAFLLPGFVWDCVLQMFLWRRENRADRAWIRFLTLSALNCGLWAWLIYLLLARVEGLARPGVAAFAWSFILFVSPAVLGAVTGFLSQRAIVRRLLARYGFHTVQPVPTAWDHAFSQSTASWVLVTLVDGSTVAGAFEDRSFASPDRAERDLFLQRLYRVEDDGPWQPVPMSSGVWIHGQAIRTIEFLAFR